MIDLLVVFLQIKTSACSRNKSLTLKKGVLGVEWQNPSKTPNIYECKVESHELFFFFSFLVCQTLYSDMTICSCSLFSLGMKIHSTLFSFITIKTNFRANSSSSISSSQSHRLRFAIQYLRLKRGFILFQLVEEILKICTNKNFWVCTTWISPFHYRVL